MGVILIPVVMNSKAGLEGEQQSTGKGLGRGESDHICEHYNVTDQFLF